MGFSSLIRNIMIVLAWAGTHEVLSMAQEPPAIPTKPSAEDKTIRLKVSPMPSTTPALRYRMFPRKPDRTPGDAAPIYLRLDGELGEEARRRLHEKPQEWLRLPFDEFPTAEARGLIEQFSGRLKQIEYGSRRLSCDWNYTVSEEMDHAFEILLPDVQSMRQWGRLVSLKARVEIAEGKFPEAARTIETGLSFARHIGEGPFFINVLVGMSVASQMFDRVDDWIGRPDAPSLYWSLTELPHSFVAVRDAMHQEQRTLDSFIPELDDLDRPRTEVEWSLLLARLHKRMSYAQKLASAGRVPNHAYSATILDIAWLKANLLPQARVSLQASRGTIDGYTDDQIIVLYIADSYREFRDDLFKPSYLPIPECFAFYAEANKRLYALKTGPLGVFAELAPAVASVHSTESRLDRKIAALRAVEAIRLQAHADGGRLPESLSKVTIVPVPLDPTTGKSFDYRREGESFILEGPAIKAGGSGPVVPDLAYRLILRQ